MVALKPYRREPQFILPIVTLSSMTVIRALKSISSIVISSGWLPGSYRRLWLPNPYRRLWLKHIYIADCDFQVLVVDGDSQVQIVETGSQVVVKLG
jgi:hypothetical protein